MFLWKGFFEFGCLLYTIDTTERAAKRIFLNEVTAGCILTQRKCNRF